MNRSMPALSCLTPATITPDFIVPAARAAIATGAARRRYGRLGLGRMRGPPTKLKARGRRLLRSLHRQKCRAPTTTPTSFAWATHQASPKRVSRKKILKTWLETKFSNAARHKRGWPKSLHWKNNFYRPFATCYLLLPNYVPHHPRHPR